MNLEECLKKHAGPAPEEFDRQVHQTRAERALSKSLKFFPVITSADLSRVFRSDACTPGGNPLIKSANGYEKIQLGTAAMTGLRGVSDVAISDTGEIRDRARPDRVRVRYQATTWIYYKDDSAMREWLQKHLKKVKCAVHYDYIE